MGRLAPPLCPCGERMFPLVARWRRHACFESQNLGHPRSQLEPTGDKWDALISRPGARRACCSSLASARNKLFRKNSLGEPNKALAC